MMHKGRGKEFLTQTGAVLYAGRPAGLARRLFWQLLPSQRRADVPALAFSLPAFVSILPAFVSILNVALFGARAGAAAYGAWPGPGFWWGDVQ